MPTPKPRRSTVKEPLFFAGRMHDIRVPGLGILSVCCEGPSCEICAKAAAAAPAASTGPTDG
jgi:hypothetical protein